MKLVKSPVLATERWTLARDLDNLRFDILSARSVADRLRHKEAEQYLAENTSAESIRITVSHLESILEFLVTVSRRMNSPKPPGTEVNPEA
jgi:hypothetical protein